MLGAMLGGRHVVIPMSIRVHCSSNHERGASVEVSASVRLRRPAISPRRPCVIAAARCPQAMGVRRTGRV